jgi:hypothetical protein
LAIARGSVVRNELQWIEDHCQLITALTGIGTLAVRVIYLQVFISNYRRQIRATLLITRGAGFGWRRAASSAT